ncbi:hypothetical protein [Aliikangiella coralliicola]|uniref:hypothetical protein n=1 Tax=Aliikangiella coralliicola TaxID=2592383 RepID=UPI00143D73BC|nr:hypothetical protein [Aliikangiella coralliicola]
MEINLFRETIEYVDNGRRFLCDCPGGYFVYLHYWRNKYEKVIKKINQFNRFYHEV